MTSKADVQRELALAAKALSGCRYLLVMPVAWYQSEDGRVWIDHLWHRDLMRHLDYLDTVTVLAPRLPYAAQAGLVAVEANPKTLRFQELPWGASGREAMLRVPQTWRVARRAVREADIVHAGIAGWPLPPGLFVNPLAVRWRKPLVIVVESAFWRLSGPPPHSRKDRIRASLTESFARWSVRQAALSIFTHEGYRASLANGDTLRTLVTPASWIDADDVLEQGEADAAWDAKSEEPRFLFAARLTEEKGLGVLLSGLAKAEAAGSPLTVDVIGDGVMRTQVQSTAAAFRHVRLRLLDPVPYGAPFLTLLRGYHALLVPSITDEQPRILFDAASQAVPVLASDTEGHRAGVQEGLTGWRFPSGDPEALLATLQRAVTDPPALRRMGLAARVQTEGSTHQAMHLQRARRLAGIYRRIGSSGS
jgi:glycosyltransferase involved in cell wall biosynthesis